MAPARAAPSAPRHVKDLSTGQLRYFLLAKLPPTVGVGAWGASRDDLLEIAKENDIEALTEEDAEELGPALPTPKKASKASVEASMEYQMRKTRAKTLRDAQKPDWKFSAQMFVVVLMAFMQGSRLEKIKVQLGLKAPPLPTCAPQPWWQKPLPWLKPGQNGECDARPEEQRVSR